MQQAPQLRCRQFLNDSRPISHTDSFPLPFWFIHILLSFFFLFTRWHVPLSHTSAKACLTGWPNAQPLGWNKCNNSSQSFRCLPFSLAIISMTIVCVYYRLLVQSVGILSVCLWYQPWLLHCGGDVWERRWRGRGRVTRISACLHAKLTCGSCNGNTVAMVMTITRS